MGTCRWLRAFATRFDSCSSSLERSAIEHVHPVRVVHGSRASCPARLLGEYINPIRRNIQCQSTSAFHLGRGWKQGGGRDAGLNPWQLARERGCEAEGGRRRQKENSARSQHICNSALNAFIANHFLLLWEGRQGRMCKVRGREGERERKGKKGER